MCFKQKKLTSKIIISSTILEREATKGVVIKIIWLRLAILNHSMLKVMEYIKSQFKMISIETLFNMLKIKLKERC
jgi:hypothetical protein